MGGGTGVIRDSGGKADGSQARVTNGNLHVQGDVGIVGPVALVEPVSVDDNGGSLTVDFDRPVPVTDNGGSLTVDAPAATPVAVRLFDGAATALGTITNPLYVLDAVEPFPLSASVGGQPITLAGVGFVALHTVPASRRDLLTIYVSNRDVTDHNMTLRLGGGAGDEMSIFLPALETVVAIHEIPLNAAIAVDADIAIAGTVHVVGRARRRIV